MPIGLPVYCDSITNASEAALFDTLTETQAEFKTPDNDIMRIEHRRSRVMREL